MKKQQLQSLKLNKKIISLMNLDMVKVLIINEI
jgi:hypothetical protein